MGEQEKLHFHEWMRRLEKFCGVQVLTHCFMENHFHLLVGVPCRRRMQETQPLTENQLRSLLPVIYSGRELRGALQELDHAAAAVDSSPGRLAEILERYEARRYSLSVFLKELKQRYTRWHNRRHKRVGTLWEHRFRSVLVEGDERALLTIAAYIDLNPVRAGIVTDPKDYRWSGYGEAVAGCKPGTNSAREGLCTMLRKTSFGVNRNVTWRVASSRYRLLLFGHGEERDADARSGSTRRSGMSREAVQAELRRGGELSVAEILRCRIRYLTEGVAIGTDAFLQDVFEENRDRFSSRRRIAGNEMRGSNWDGLRVLAGLRTKLFN